MSNSSIIPLPKFLSANFAEWEKTGDTEPPKLVIHTVPPRCILTINYTHDDDGNINGMHAIPHTWIDDMPDHDAALQICQGARKFHYHVIKYAADNFEERLKEIQS